MNFFFFQLVFVAALSIPIFLSKNSVPSQPTYPWEQEFELLENLFGSYLTVVRVPGRGLYLFNNKNLDHAEIPRGLMLYRASSLKIVGEPELVAPNKIIDDVLGQSGEPDPSIMITRPSVVYSENANEFYAMIHITKGYPSSDKKMRPAFMSSKDGFNWKYHGQLKGEVGEELDKRQAFISASTALMVNENYSAGLDHRNPTKNRFVFYSDGFIKPGGIVLLYSKDGREWFFAKNSHGGWLDVRPETFQIDPVKSKEDNIFLSVARTPFGIHMYSTIGWPPKGHRHFFSKDGLKFEAINGSLEDQYGGDTAIKNMSLFYDEPSNRVYGFPTLLPKHRKMWSWFEARDFSK